MSGIVDPSTPEREAREAVLFTMRHGNWPSDTNVGDKDAERRFANCDRQNAELLDAYAAAVRARALADVAGWVEGMRVAQPFVECQSCTELHSCANGHHVLSHNVLAYNAALDAVQAKLPEAK